MIIARQLIDQLIAQAIAEAPRECCGMIGVSCGMIGVRDDEVVTVYPATNAAESETRYEIDGAEQMVILRDIEERGERLGAIYHSHTHAPPVPSQTDIKTWGYPDALCVIVGIGWLIDDPPMPPKTEAVLTEVRAWRINSGYLETVEEELITP